MEQKQPAILIQNQYIKDLSMEIPHAPAIFKKLQGTNPKVNVEVNVEVEKLEEEKTFNVVLNVAVNGDVEEEKAFILELSYAAVVSLNIPEEHREPVLMMEIPHMIYPFARQIVANTMSNAGLPPLMLNPIDFMAMYNARKANAQAVKQ
ncbi:MAG: protein-export chaperone SecB [Alphaproteobacteria bacterium]|nr:protein-export chaperone SecB [Alphaproteobacteria bacterium]